MNVLIVVIAFFIAFTVGIVLGRELTYLADGRRRRKERRFSPWNVKQELGEPYDEILDLELIASYDPKTGMYKGDEDIPPVAGGYMNDESKHWPKGGDQ